jgi:hypothetical protein
MRSKITAIQIEQGETFFCALISISKGFLKFEFSSNVAYSELFGLLRSWRQGFVRELRLLHLFWS